VVYLLIDHDRYLKARESPLERFVTARPPQVRLVWRSGPEPSAMEIYEVLPTK
jgi:hypothetical protein